MISKFDKEYKWLSNFSPVTIELDYIIYPSVEHAYQSCKSSNLNWKWTCADINNSAGTIKKKSNVIKRIDNWSEIKEQVMEICLIQKFNKEPV